MCTMPIDAALVKFWVSVHTMSMITQPSIPRKIFTERINLYLPVNLRAELEQICRARHMKLSEFVRQAIARQLDEEYHRG